MLGSCSVWMGVSGVGHRGECHAGLTVFPCGEKVVNLGLEVWNHNGVLCTFGLLLVQGVVYGVGCGRVVRRVRLTVTQC